MSATLVAKKDHSLGTGCVTLDGGTLRFENTQPVVFTNDIAGVGTVEIAGAPVSFTCESLSPLPFKTLAAGSSFSASDPSEGTFVPSVSGTFDLGGRDVTVAGIAGSGRVVNGTLTVTGEIHPGGVGTIGTLVFDRAPVTTSATRLVIEDSDGEMDLLVVEGPLDLSALSLDFRLIAGNRGETRREVVRADGLLGDFATVVKSPSRAKRATVSVSGDSVWVEPRCGFSVIVR